MKEGSKFIFVLGLVLILSFSFVSANILEDMWGKFTGEVIAGESAEGYWTSWYDSDNPGGSGDYETISVSLEKYSDMCESPTKIECEVVDDSVMNEIVEEQRENVVCNTDVGFYCKNEDVDGDCLDYKVRFYCGEEEDVSYCDEEGDCVLYEGEITYYENYEISILFIQAGEVKLKVGEEVTNTLEVGNQYRVNEGTTLIRIGNINFFQKEGELSYIRFKVLDLLEVLCIDSDDGIDPFEKGTITYLSEGKVLTSTEVCVRDNYKESEVNKYYLFEEYCNEDGFREVLDGRNVIYCKEGCEEGACKGNKHPTCSQKSVCMPGGYLRGTLNLDCSWKETEWCSNSCEDGACVGENQTFYPQPFLSNGLADVAIVYGTAEGVSQLEMVSAGRIQSDLNKNLNWSIGDVLIKDSELGSLESTNLIVVGTANVAGEGSGCSNKAIEEIGEFINDDYCDDLKELNEGEFVIESVGVEDNVALLVVGYDVSSLMDAVNYLINNKVETTVGTRILGCSDGACMEENEKNESVYFLKIFPLKFGTESKFGLGYNSSLIKVYTFFPKFIDCSHKVISPTGKTFELGAGGCFSEGKMSFSFNFGFHFSGLENSEKIGIWKIIVKGENNDSGYYAKNFFEVFPGNESSYCDSEGSCVLYGGENVEFDEKRYSFDGIFYDGFGTEKVHFVIFNTGIDNPGRFSGVSDGESFLLEDGTKITVLEIINPSEKTGLNEGSYVKFQIFYSPKIEDCDFGCSLDNKCYNYGFVKKGKFCSEIENQFIEQLDANIFCENGFECSSGLCVNNQCLDSSIWQKILDFFSRLF